MYAYEEAIGHCVDPAAVRALLTRMESREFLYLKQVMSLVILELWHRVFVDKSIKFD